MQSWGGSPSEHMLQALHVLYPGTFRFIHNLLVIMIAMHEEIREQRTCGSCFVRTLIIGCAVMIGACMLVGMSWLLDCLCRHELFILSESKDWGEFAPAQMQQPSQMGQTYCQSVCIRWNHSHLHTTSAVNMLLPETNQWVSCVCRHSTWLIPRSWYPCRSWLTRWSADSLCSIVVYLMDTCHMDISPMHIRMFFLTCQDAGEISDMALLDLLHHLWLCLTDFVWC